MDKLEKWVGLGWIFMVGLILGWMGLLIWAFVSLVLWVTSK